MIRLYANDSYLYTTLRQSVLCPDAPRVVTVKETRLAFLLDDFDLMLFLMQDGI